MRNILGGSGIKIIQADDPVTLGEKFLAQMGTQKARPTSYENSFHVSPIVAVTD